MKVLVAGGAGFIGSHLTDKLIEGGHDVTVLDNLYTGKEENVNRKARFIKEKVGFHREDYDWVFNLACPASPKHYQRNPINTAMTNVIGTRQLLELTHDGARMLQASTSEVYGDPLVSPQHEDYWGNVNPIGVRSCYDEGKRMAECLCYDFQRFYDADIRVARIFNTYGPRMAVDDGRVVSNFIVQALRGEPITIYGDGKQTRSLCYVDDTVDGLLALMQSDETRPVNIGRDLEMTIMDLATVILDLTKSSSSIISLPLPEDDPKQRRPDLKRAKSIGWEAKTLLTDGLMETIDYFRRII